mmetsp:Transcript_8422/g.21667  ORF Transcript_8422/g.21667 Transcript_8422/m.21667 type:complete len:219 (+) Transcript_8422:604-1260(+)
MSNSTPSMVSVLVDNKLFLFWQMATLPKSIWKRSASLPKSGSPVPVPEDFSSSAQRRFAPGGLCARHHWPRRTVRATPVATADCVRDTTLTSFGSSVAGGIEDGPDVVRGAGSGFKKVVNGRFAREQRCREVVVAVGLPRVEGADARDTSGSGAKESRGREEVDVEARSPFGEVLHQFRDALGLDGAAEERNGDDESLDHACLLVVVDATRRGWAASC